MLHSNKLRSVQGFSLLELLLVVAVGSVLILAGLGTYRLVSESNNTNQAVRQLMTLKQQVQQTFAGESNYPATNALTTRMQDMRTFPPDIAVVTASTGTLRGALGTMLLAGSASTNFTITMRDVPRTACVKLALAFTPNTASDLESLSIGGTNVSTFTQASLLGTAAGTCRTSAANNDMVWTFH